MATSPTDKSVNTVEEEEAPTEEVDPAETTEEEEEEVRTEEDESEGEDTESFYDSDLNNYVTYLTTEDEEPIVIQRSEQTMYHGSASFASDQNRRLVPPNHSHAQTFQAMRPRQQNLGLRGSLVTQPPYQNQIPWSDQTMNQQQGFTIPNLGLPPFAPVYNNFNYMDQQPFPMVFTGQSWVPQYSQEGFGPYGSLGVWSTPCTDYVVPPVVAPGQAPMRPMRPMMQQNQNVPLLPGHNLMRPVMHLDQSVLNAYPAQAPMWPMMYNQVQGQIGGPFLVPGVPNLLPGHYLMRPVMQQDQSVLNAFPAQAPMRPMMYNQEQGQIPFLVPGQAPMWPRMYNHSQIAPRALPNHALVPMMYNQQQQFNQGQHFGFPMDMIHHRASLNAAARVPRPELSHQQMQQLQPQMQQPTQSQGFDDGSSSGQSQE